MSVVVHITKAYASLLISEGYAKAAVLDNIAKGKYSGPTVYRYLALASEAYRTDCIAKDMRDHRREEEQQMRALAAVLAAKADAKAHITALHEGGFFDTDHRREAFRAAWAEAKNNRPQGHKPLEL
jgi:hypothetical protein